MTEGRIGKQFAKSVGQFIATHDYQTGSALVMAQSRINTPTVTGTVSLRPGRFDSTFSVNLKTPRGNEYITVEKHVFGLPTRRHRIVAIRDNQVLKGEEAKAVTQDITNILEEEVIKAIKKQ